MYCVLNSLRHGIRRGILLHILAGWLVWSPTPAIELGDAVQVHGFASQAYIYTSDNNFFGQTSDGGDFDYTELGLNASASLHPQLQVAAQVLSRRAGEGDDGDIRLDYGFADFTILSDPRARWGVRGGRILNPLGFYNETRDVAFTRPSILLPQSIYFDRTRELALSSDGGLTYGEYRFSGNELFWQLAYAYPQVDGEETEKAFLGALRPGDLDSAPSVLGRVLLEADGGRIRLALSAAKVNVDYDPGSVDPFQDGSITFEPVILSAQYNTEAWSLTAEYARRHFAYNDIFPLLDRTFTGESGYLQGVYRFAPGWDALLRYDVLYTDRDDRNGNDYQAQTGMPDYSRFAKDLTFGVGWQVNRSLLLRAEYHVVEGTAWLPVDDNPNPLATEKDWRMFAFQASLRF